MANRVYREPDLDTFDYDAPEEESTPKWAGSDWDYNSFSLAKPGDELVWYRVARSGPQHMTVSRREVLIDVNGAEVPISAGATFVSQVGDEVRVTTHGDNKEHTLSLKNQKQSTVTVPNGKKVRPAVK